MAWDTVLKTLTLTAASAETAKSKQQPLPSEHHPLWGSTTFPMTLDGKAVCTQPAPQPGLLNLRNLWPNPRRCPCN